MLPEFCDDFLDSEENYAACEAFWREAVEAIAESVGQAGEWPQWAPIYRPDGKRYDFIYGGGLICDGISHRLGRSFRIHQWIAYYGEGPIISAYISSFDEDHPREHFPRHDLSILLSLTEETFRLAKELLRKWMLPETSIEEMDRYLDEGFPEVTSGIGAELHLKVRRDALERDKKAWPPSTPLSPGALLTDYFRHGVAFRVEYSGMFGDLDNPTDVVPLLGLVLHLRRALDHSHRRASSEWELPSGSRTIVFRGFPLGYVHVTGPSGNSGFAKREDIEAAMDGFDATVRSFLLDNFPGIQDDPELGGWFRQEGPPAGFFG